MNHDECQLAKQVSNPLGCSTCLDILKCKHKFPTNVSQDHLILINNVEVNNDINNDINNIIYIAILVCLIYICFLIFINSKKIELDYHSFNPI